MAKILSQEEIDALLGAAAKREASSQDSAAGNEASVTYNFRRPDRVSKEQIRSLQFLHDRFARNVSTSLSAYLRSVTEVAIVSVEQFTYSEFLMSLPDPTAFYAVALRPLDLVGALEMNPNVAFTMIDRMLGGSGRGLTMQRALTEIEQNVVDAAVKLILENLTEAWQPILDVQFKIGGRETRPQMLQVAAPNDAVILVVFDIRIGEARGMLNLCIPAGVTEAAGAGFIQGYYRTRREPSEMERSRLFQTLATVPVSLEAILETRLAAREVVELCVNDVISLGHPIDRPVRVRLGGAMKFAGHLMRHGDRAGLSLVPLEQADEGAENYHERS
jgi:flagellar motor switch protein FliM